MKRKQCEEANWTIYEDGAIVSNKTGKKRKTFINNCGYEMVTYTSKEGTKNFYVHHLVAKYFVGNRPKGYAINHIDGNKQNNSVENLEYVTYKENIAHADKNGLRKNFAAGQQNGMSKLSNDQAKALIQGILNGQSNKDLGERFGLHSRYVSLIRHKRRWKALWREVEGSTTIESTPDGGSE